MILVINELSYSDALTAIQAKVWYDNFFLICLQMELRFKSKIGLKFSSSPIENNFHLDYTFMKWISDQGKEQKSSVLSMLTREKIVHNYPSFKSYNAEGQGLGYAYEHDESLISFQSSENWLKDFIPVIQENLNENNDIETEELTLRNLYDFEKSLLHQEYFANKFKMLKDILYDQIDTGLDLWEKRAELFPYLEFCHSTKDFVEDMAGDIFRNVLKKLKEYNQYFSEWKTGDFDRSILSGNVRLESETRIRDFGSQLTIACPDGENRLFSLHGNIGNWGYRIHLYPITASRKCIIGYVGKKIV